MSASTPVTTAKKIGLVAGWGRFPIVVAKALKQQGFQVYCIGVRGHADPVLAEICDDFRISGLAKTGAQARYFRRRGCNNATMAGKIFKTILFEKFALIRHLPDLGFMRCFFSVYVTRNSDRRDDTMLGLITNYFDKRGIKFLPATDYAPELLVSNGRLTKYGPSPNEIKDIQFGWKMAREMGRFDIGQSVVVKDRVVMAVEAIEGTDECIKRAGQLCAGGGFTVVKVAKPNQDMRFDVPTIGVGTIETIHNAGGKILAIEAEKTIVLDQEQTVATANRLGIKIVAMKDSEVAHAAA